MAEGGDKKVKGDRVVGVSVACEPEIMAERPGVSTKVNLANVPVLKVVESDVSGSYSVWKTKLRVFLRVKQVETGRALSEEVKILTLLSAVGDDGLS